MAQSLSPDRPEGSPEYTLSSCYMKAIGIKTGIPIPPPVSVVDNDCHQDFHRQRPRVGPPRSVAELDFNTQAAAVTPEPPAAEKDR
jgi:hypothetical protein